MSIAEIKHFHLFCGLGGGAVGWGSACRDCIDEPHDCEECMAWARANYTEDFTQEPKRALPLLEVAP